eukprot:3794429-Prymnesium_polylepis.1
MQHAAHLAGNIDGPVLREVADRVEQVREAPLLLAFHGVRHLQTVRARERVGETVSLRREQSCDTTCDHVQYVTEDVFGRWPMLSPKA